MRAGESFVAGWEKKRRLFAKFAMKVIAIQALPFQRVVRAKNFPCLAPVSQVNMAHLFALTSLLYLERMILW